MGGICCGDDVPDEILPDPQFGYGYKIFCKEESMFNSNWTVFQVQPDFEKKKWLRFKKESSFWDKNLKFELENYVRNDDGEGQIMCKGKIEGLDPDIDKIEYDISDSDSGGWDPDDWFDDSDEQEFECKMKWRIKRDAHFVNPLTGNTAELKVKMKGKSKAEIEVETYRDEEGHERQRETQKCKTKVKKVYYKLKCNDQEVPIKYENDHWDRGDRNWSSTLWDCQYDSKFGKDELDIQSHQGGDPNIAMAVAMSLGAYFHPAKLGDAMDNMCLNKARQLKDRFGR